MPHGAEERAVRRAVARAKSATRVVVSGIGPHAAALAAGSVTALGDVRRVVVVGLCGVLTSAHRVTEPLVYGELVGPGGRIVTLDRELARELSDSIDGSQSGIRAIESATIVTRTSEKRVLAERFNAQAVDMESFAIAGALAETGVRIGVVRIASDDARADLPELERALNGSGGIDGFALTIAIARRPLAGARLIRDGLRALAALERAIYAICSSVSTSVEAS